MTRRGRVVVVGLGPGGADLLLPAARDALERLPHRFARTGRHPAVADLAREGISFVTGDDLYERGPDLDAVYGAIVERVAAAAAEHGEVAYAVPGSPVVAERTVAMLRAADVELEVVPGLSFVDLAWVRLGVDPMRGARVVDAREFAVAAADVAGPLLVAQCDTRPLLSDVKLALLEHLEPDTPVTVLCGLGTSGETVRVLPLAELDRSFEPDHLTSLYVDPGAHRLASEVAALYALAERLRGPGGCPWDAAQTHHSLRPHLLEEAYEVAEAIDALPPEAPGGDEPLPSEAYAALEDELGDLLFQVVIHTVLAGEAGAFTLGDVAAGIHDKLVRRHPHVFGDVVVEGADGVVATWEQIKQEERGTTSVVAGLTPGLPALLYAGKVARRAAKLGLEPGRDEALAELVAGRGGLERPDEVLGAALAALVVVAGDLEVDPESALRAWAARCRERLAALEGLAGERGLDLATLRPDALAALWEEAATAGPGPGGRAAR